MAGFEVCQLVQEGVDVNLLLGKCCQVLDAGSWALLLVEESLDRIESPQGLVASLLAVSVGCTEG